MNNEFSVAAAEGVNLDDGRWYLYGLCRTDLASMNPGKLAAQLMHAQSHAHFDIIDNGAFGERMKALYNKWRNQTNQGFGTTITLNCGNGKSLEDLVQELKAADVPCGLTFDPTYPVIDGQVVHLVPLVTCGWAFAERDLHANILGRFDLHP